MNRRRHFHQRWLLWGLVWVFMLASLAPAISRMQAAGALAMQGVDGKPGLTASAAASGAPNGSTEGAASSALAEAGQQVRAAAQPTPEADHTICFPDEDTAASFAQETLVQDGAAAAVGQTPVAAGGTQQALRQIGPAQADPGLDSSVSRPASSVGAGPHHARLDPHAGHGHHGGLTGEPDNLLVQLSVGMPSLDCCPFCSIMADRLAPVWFDVPLLLDRTLVRARPEFREPMPPAVVVLRLPPVRGPPATPSLSV